MPRSFLHWRLITLVFWAISVAYLTLRGGEPAQFWLEEMPRLCLLCGTRGTADALLNVILFVPLGMALGGTRSAVVRGALAGFAVSVCIESIQVFVPGRHATVSDLLWNTLGAVVGVWLTKPLLRRFRETWRMDVAWGGILAFGFITAGVLVNPSPTDSDYWGQWTPDLGSMPKYDGQVLEARINGMELPSRRLDYPGSDGLLLVEPWGVEAIVAIGPAPEAIAPILSLVDGQTGEILLLGAHRDDLVFRERMLAQRLRFDALDIRIPEALATLTPGDTTLIRARRADGSLCLGVADEEECDLGVTPGRTWGLLLYVEGPREWFRDVVDVVWLTVLFFPVGFFGGSWRRMAVGMGIGVVGLGVAVSVTPLILGPWRELLACVGGVILGWGSARVLELAVRPSQGPAEPSISASV